MLSSPIALTVIPFTRIWVISFIEYSPEVAVIQSQHLPKRSNQSAAYLKAPYNLSAEYAVPVKSKTRPSKLLSIISLAHWGACWFESFSIPFWEAKFSTHLISEGLPLGDRSHSDAKWLPSLCSMSLILNSAPRPLMDTTGPLLDIYSYIKFPFHVNQAANYTD